MDLSVDYQSASPKDNAYDIAVNQITPEYVDQFGVKAEISYDRDQGLISATGKGFTLNLWFSDKACDVELKLSMMLKPLKGKILDKVERKLKKHV